MTGTMTDLSNLLNLVHFVAPVAAGEFLFEVH